MYINRFVRILKYYFKQCNSDNIIINAIVEESVSDIEKGKTNWFIQVRDIFSRYGFYDVWLCPRNVHEGSFLTLFKQRLINEFLQKWRADVSTNNVLLLYKHFRTTFCLETYLDGIISRRLRAAITKILISSHNLRIQTGRYAREGLDRNQRYCQLSVQFKRYRE